MNLKYKVLERGFGLLKKSEGLKGGLWVKKAVLGVEKEISDGLRGLKNWKGDI